MHGEVLNWVYISAAAGLTNIALIRMISGQLLTPCAFYWVGWTLALLSFSVGASLETMPEPVPITFEMIGRSHLGAFFGFLGATLFARILWPTQSSSPLHKRMTNPSSWKEIRKISQKLSLAMLALGAFSLLYRIVALGGFNASFISDARENFIGEDKGFFRIALYLIGIFTIPAILIGLQAAKNQPVRRQATTLLTGILLYSLADASRLKIFLTVFFILISYLLVQSEDGLKKVIKAIWEVRTKLTLGAIILLIFFQGLVTLRTGNQLIQSPLAMIESSAANISDYNGLALSAMGPYTERFPKKTAGGSLSFAFVFKWTQRIGLTPQLANPAAYFDTDFFKYADPRIARCGFTTLPFLVADFGLNALWFVQFIIMASLQLIFFWAIRKSFLGFILAVHLCCTAYLSMWTWWLLTAPMILPLIWGSFLLKKIRRHNKHKPRKPPRRGPRRRKSQYKRYPQRPLQRPLKRPLQRPL